jgi:CRISPR-associated protein Cas1
MYLLVTYDIVSDKRRRKVDKLLSEYGFRVNYSVFELEIGKTIVKSKAKNQLNLIKYFARYREDTDQDEYKKLEKIIKKIEKLYKQIDFATENSILMGYEGNISNNYWRAFGILIDQPDFKRSTQNAPDPINQAINYGYGFLYNRIQSAIIKTGLSLYHSFLHVEQSGKPTLVFDLIEEFRQPVVDREIISIINRGTTITSSKGKLTQKSIKVISQNIQERLITMTKYRNKKYKLTTIIDEQVLTLSHAIQNENKKYKGFVARY